LSDSSYKTAFKVAVILFGVGLVLSLISIYVPATALYIGIASWVLVSIILAIWLIKSNYELEFGKSILVWLVWFAFNLVVSFVIGMIIAAILVAVGIGIAAGGAI